MRHSRGCTPCGTVRAAVAAPGVRAGDVRVPAGPSIPGELGPALGDRALTCEYPPWRRADPWSEPVASNPGRVPYVLEEDTVTHVALRPVEDPDLDPLFDQMRDPESVWMAAFTAEDPDDRDAFD